MNPRSLSEAKHIAGDIKKGLRMVKKTQVVMCPPFIYLGALSNIPTNLLFLGAQNASSELSGAHTGEVSFSQLPDLKVSMVIIGHSERSHSTN